MTAPWHTLGDSLWGTVSKLLVLIAYSMGSWFDCERKPKEEPSTLYSWKSKCLCGSGKRGFPRKPLVPSGSLPTRASPAIGGCRANYCTYFRHRQFLYGPLRLLSLTGLEIPRLIVASSEWLNLTVPPRKLKQAFSPLLLYGRGPGSYQRQHRTLSRSRLFLRGL